MVDVCDAFVGSYLDRLQGVVNRLVVPRAVNQATVHHAILFEEREVLCDRPINVHCTKTKPLLPPVYIQIDVGLL